MSTTTGKRPRGHSTRPYARSIQLDVAEYLAVKRWADEHDLAFGAAFRELARLGLAAEAERHPEAAHWDALVVAGITAPDADPAHSEKLPEN